MRHADAQMVAEQGSAQRPPEGRDLDRSTGRALAAIACTWIGTGMAYLTTPEDVVPAGVLMEPAWWQTAGLLSVPVASALQSWRRVFRVEYLLMVGLVFWLLLDMIQGAYPMVGLAQVDVNLIFVAIAVMATAVWLGTIRRPWRLPQPVHQAATLRFEPQHAFGLILLFFSLGMLKFLWPVGFNPVTAFSYLDAPRFQAPWSRGSMGGWNAFLDHLDYFGYVLPALTAILGRYAGWWNWRTVVSLLLSIVMILFLAQGGGRRIIGVTVGAAIVCWFLLQHRLQLSRVLVGFLLIAGLLWTMQMVLEFRGTGFQALSEGQELRSSRSHFHVDDNFYRLGQTIQFFPEEHAFVKHQQIYYVMVRPIPRVFWPGKPEGPGYDLSDLAEVEGASLSASVISELFASWGWFMVVLGGYFYGRLASMWNQVLYLKRSPYAVLVYALGTLAIFAGLRSMQDLVIMSYALLAWIGGTYLFQRFATDEEATSSPARRGA